MYTCVGGERPAEIDFGYFARVFQGRVASPDGWMSVVRLISAPAALVLKLCDSEKSIHSQRLIISTVKPTDAVHDWCIIW